MLRHTFIHLPGVGSVTEAELWSAGVTTWEQFLDCRVLPSRVQWRRDELCAQVIASQSRLRDADAFYFDSSLPGAERWRLYADFRQCAAFLDIETTGLSAQQGHITMVGLLDAQGYTPFVWGENLEDIRSAVERYDLIVTFNGASFDIPFIEHHFGHIFRRTAHIDLRFPLRRLGYKGGLKSIESQLGLSRPSDLSGLDGFDAVLLWQMWRKGDKGARDTLVRYNAEDVASLPALADLVYNRLASRLPVPFRPLDPTPRNVIDLPYDVDARGRLRRIRSPHMLYLRGK